ncbi:PREDICTED: MATH domain and coiled-coil domain-containing protein At3g58270-like isoform X1 [Brassica oleracea var. oleracea]|uniref:MATH domain and coiled-coil domain-containing protein At3g58270-like isoform X1 n=1 Tax=Brassica oleracea var. oleracea TaxID=109376 RepID=UPI0006A6D49E|nr:PREDICTED: MATH domain and coiled-coil domain-containing protein At3g58270-like isoform X1 [Brassica oleracea var. oleracea]XP_013588855.1 PREDICTED: MATH domain and coiled-coil domain-containing protein At3g58270-like isoform X1 [Brassica oleracea var. oleracea]
MGKQEVDNKFTWVIRNFSSLQSRKVYSDEFIVGGCKWRLLAFPKGNGGVKTLSLYLDVAGSASLPYGWRRRAELCLSVVNHVSEELTEIKATEHWFDAEFCDFGFTTMLPLDKIHDKDGGFLVNGDLEIVAEVEVLEVIGKLDVSEETKLLSKVEEDDGAEARDSLELSVNGFQVLPSQVESVRRIFERHPDIASKFRPKNQHLRTAYINILLSLINTLCQPTKDLSKDDLNDAYENFCFKSINSSSISFILFSPASCFSFFSSNFSSNQSKFKPASVKYAKLSWRRRKQMCLWPKLPYHSMMLFDRFKFLFLVAWILRLFGDK